MASDIESTCENDPNFAVICAFLEKFGSQCSLPNLDFLELQKMLEDTEQVDPSLVNIFMKLLRRAKKTVKPDKWEKSLVAVCHKFNTQDAWEIERFGYKKAKLTSKVRVLKELLEMQFDCHVKFKNEVNKLSANDLRSQPLGKDKTGHAYWFQSDENYQIRVYKENLDDETWTLIAKDRESLISLINKLRDGGHKFSSDSAPNEDSNSCEKPVIDTGQENSVIDENLYLNKTIYNENERGKVDVDDKTEEAPKPMLRIKSLSELMDTSLKCSRNEEDNNETYGKLLRVDLSKIEVGETNEEPLVRMDVGGTGVENEDKNPIIGEITEEEVVYFHGEGSGHSCQTGNEETTIVNSENGTSNESQNESINDLGEIKNNSKVTEVPSKLGDVCNDVKTGNNICNSSPNLSEKLKKDGEHCNQNSNEMDISNVNILEPQKNIFFFGAPSQSNSLCPSLTMGFGKVSQMNDVLENKDSDGETTKISESKAHGKFGTQISKRVEPVEDLFHGESESLPKKSKRKEVSEKGEVETEILSNNMSPNENLASQTKSLNEFHVNEEPCIKKVAYVCGKREGENEIAPEVCNNDLDTVTATKKKLEPKEFDTTKISFNNELGKHIKDGKRPSNVLPKMSLRSVRTKKLVNCNVIKNDKSSEENTTNKIIPKVNIPEKKSAEISIRIKKLLPTKAKDVQTEEVYVKGRRELQTKNTEASPRTIVPKKNKMAVTTKKKNKGKAESLVEKDSHTTSLNEKGIAVSPNSSQISSSLSITDSISTFPEPLGNNSVEDKDPLAESDQEVTTSKPMNLQSFSFDFNESSTVPQIPVDSKRMLRKREREASPAANPMQNVEIKRKKLKGKRQINTKLRKSIELLKEQQVSSSDEDIINIPDDNSKGKKSLLKHKKKKVIASKKKEESLVTISDDSNSTPYFPPKSRKQNKENGDHETRHSDNKNKRLLAGLNVSDIQLSGVRQSRRLAQIKIKEQVEDKKPEPSAKEEKEKKTKNKSITSGKLKKHKPIILSIEPVQKHEVTKKKKKKSKLPNKIFDEHRPWKSSSGSSEEEGEEEVEDEEEIVEEELPLEFLSDHEFSPESDLGSADEYQPLKRARTAKRKYEDDSVEAEKKEEDFPCQKCGKSDHPEMVLLCDKCDNGWHCSCLRPPILSIPEGDWFCPPCQHVKLVENLHDKLTEYDKKLTKKGLEDRRKERLAYVGISLNNVLPSREKEQQKNYLSSSVESQSSASDLESSSDEPIYQLRQRRQAKSYKFNEYDELIKSAIQDELNEKRDKVIPDSPCRGKDMATIVKAEGEDRKEEEELEKKRKQTSTEDNPDSIVEPKPEKSNSEDDIIKAPVNILKKKARRICSLDLSSEEDDERDEDFKGSSSSSEDDDFENESEDSDEFLLGKKRKNLRPLRRSTRARVSRFDADFLDDDEEDDIPKKKKKPQYFSESDSSDDTSWKKKKWSHCAKKKTSRKKKKIFEELSDLDIAKKKKPKIKYGGLTSSEEEMGRGRRTRGKKTTYVDTLGSDSEEECRKKNFGSDNEDDEDFVANEEDEKDSEEIPEDLVNDDDDESVEERKNEEAERRTLIVPKIYIKKPPVSRDIEKNRERILTNEQKEVVENRKNVVLEENEKIQKNPIIKENLVHIEQKSNTNNCERTENLTKHLKEQKLKVTGEEFITSEKSKTTEILKRAKEEKEMLSLPHHEISRSLSSKLEDDNKCYYEENSYLSGNPTDDSQKKSENLAPGDTKRIMEEDYTNTNLESVMVQIEKKKKRKAAEDKTKDLQSHPHFDERTQPVEKGRQTESKSLERIKHRPIITNVRNMIKNYDSNEELSEPPMGVSLPLFEELASKGTDESNKKKRERGKGNKKTLEETVGDLVEKKKTQPDISQSTIPNIEIAAPPQPFSQDDPTPSTITRMLQTKPEQTTTYPIGSIRPKRFATMPDDDDESPSNKSKSRGSSPTIAPPRMDGSPSGDYMIGGPRSSHGTFYRTMYINHHPRGILPTQQIRGPTSLGTSPAQHIIPPTYLPCATTTSPSLYESYPAVSMTNEDAMSPRTFENPPYSEPYENEIVANLPETTENCSSKSFGEEESGGEFGGLVSYFSSQQEDNLDS